MALLPESLKSRVLIPFALGAVALAGVGCATSETKTLSNDQAAAYHLQIGNGALTEGDPTGALIEFKESEKLRPEVPSLHHSKALAYYLKHDLKTAIACEERALSLDPGYSDAHSTIGKFLMDAGKYAEAEKHLSLAAKDPLYRDAYKAMTSLGIIAYRRGDNELAQKQLKDAILAGGTRSCVAHYYLGNIKMKDSDVLSALDEYDQSVNRFCGKFPEGHFAKGVALLKSGRNDDARKQFLEVKKLFPNSDYAKKAMDQLRYIP